MLSPRSELHLQISLLACQAVQSDDPVQHLAGNVQFHNITEFRYETETPVNYVLLVSDGRVELDSQCKQQNQMKLEPTVYVAFSNDVNELTGFPASSLANFFCGQQPSGFVLAEDACIQSLVAYVLKEIPLQPFINLLGQGYSLVLTGHRFGGMVANALAAQLLLQLRQELSMAEQMGVNVTALSQTLKKLTSYAFGAPLFCSKALQATLREQDLHGQINTVLTSGDASPPFLTLCAELFSPGSAAEPPFRHRPYSDPAQARRSASALSDDLDFCHDPLSNRASSLDLNAIDLSSQQKLPAGSGDFSLDGTQVQSKNFSLIQAWAGAVLGEMTALAEGPRLGAVRAETFATAQLPTRAVLLRATAAAASTLEQSFLEPSRFSPNHPSHTLLLLQQQHHPSTTSEHRTASPVPRRTEDPKRALVSHSSLELHVGSPPATTTKARLPGSGGLKPGPAVSAVLASSPPLASISVRASSSKQLTSTSTLRSSSSSTPTSPLTPTGTKLGSSAHTSSPASLLSNGGVSSKPSSNKTIRSANQHPKVQSISNDGSGQRGVGSGKGAAEVKAGASSWKSALQGLLAAQREITEPLYVPVGHFWLLSVATDTVSSAVVRLDCEKRHRGLVELDGSCVCQSISTWLAADNTQLFMRWELQLEELQPIIMEAFAWSSFVKSIDHHGAMVERESLMNPERSFY